MDTALATLFSPVILFFILGALAAAARSDLAMPDALAKGMSMYLMVAIGLKGGVEVAKGGVTPDMLKAAIAGIALSAVLPLLAYAALRRPGRLDTLNAGAVAAHYGSVSVVTFVTATEILVGRQLAPGGYMVAVMALMETPAIVTGLWLARRGQSRSSDGNGNLWHEVFLNGSVVLLIGSFIIGVIVGPEGIKPVKPVFDGGFRGVLCLFLLDMGLVAVRRLQASGMLSIRLAGLAVLLPLINGVIGAGLGTLIGLPPGSTAALATLAASASYIAVPAAVRLALPEANPGLSLSMSLAVTFPFNIILGIPLYAAMAQWMQP